MKSEAKDLLQKIKSGNFAKENPDLLSIKESQEEPKEEWSPENEIIALTELEKKLRKKEKIEFEEREAKKEAKKEAERLEELNKTQRQIKKELKEKEWKLGQRSRDINKQIEEEKKYVETPQLDHLIKYCEDNKLNYFTCPTLLCDEVLLDNKLLAVRHNIESKYLLNQQKTPNIKLKNANVYCPKCGTIYPEITIKTIKLVELLATEIKKIKEKIGDI